MFVIFILQKFLKSFFPIKSYDDFYIKSKSILFLKKKYLYIFYLQLCRTFIWSSSYVEAKNLISGGRTEFRIDGICVPPYFGTFKFNCITLPKALTPLSVRPAFIYSHYLISLTRLVCKSA